MTSVTTKFSTLKCPTTTSPQSRNANKMTKFMPSPNLDSTAESTSPPSTLTAGDSAQMRPFKTTFKSTSMTLMKTRVKDSNPEDCTTCTKNKMQYSRTFQEKRKALSTTSKATVHSQPNWDCWIKPWFSRFLWPGTLLKMVTTSTLWEEMESIFWSALMISFQLMGGIKNPFGVFLTTVHGNYFYLRLGLRKKEDWEESFEHNQGSSCMPLVSPVIPSKTFANSFNFWRVKSHNWSWKGRRKKSLQSIGLNSMFLGKLAATIKSKSWASSKIVLATR